MNGSLNPVLWWVIQGLIGLVIGLIGLVLRSHNERDEERHKNMASDVKELQAKLVTMQITVSQLKAKE